ncbi:Lysine-specific demethylase 4C [Blattella germanica]|nr:Lysine-specific demethylase 4C [Blattella germanica]
MNCIANKCNTKLHPMCALVSGSQFNVSYSGFTSMVTVKCKGHGQKPEKLICVHVGELVWAKHKNGRYYKAKVDTIQETLFYMVLFSDESFSDDLYPQDITNYNCLRDGPPASGVNVDVQWSDGLIYSGQFLGTNHQLMYTVVFEDNSRLTMKRDAIFHLDEDLPKRVRGKLSVATVMKHEDHLQVSPDLTGQQRANRGTNPKYNDSTLIIPSTSK